MKYKLLITSDIHIDNYKYNKNKLLEKILKKVNNIDPNIFIICGDLSANIKLLKTALNILGKNNAKNIFIPGNHDLWSENNLDSFTKHEKIIPNICNNTNWHYLPNSPFILNNIGIAGNCGWYDYTFKSPYFPEISDNIYKNKTFRNNCWQDKKFIKFNNMNDIKITEFMIKKFNNSIKTLKEKKITKWIACFHHHIFKNHINYKNIIDWDFFGAYMGSKKFNDIFNDNKEFIGFVEAHSHNSYFYKKNNKFYCNSPLKYEHEWKKKLSIDEIIENSLKLIIL